MMKRELTGRHVLFIAVTLYAWFAVDFLEFVRIRRLDRTSPTTPQ